MHHSTSAPLSGNLPSNLSGHVFWNDGLGDGLGSGLIQGHIAHGATHDPHDHAAPSTTQRSDDDDDSTRGTYATTSITNNIYIDGILWGGNYIDSGPITYSFWDDRNLDNDFFDIATDDSRGPTDGGLAYVWNQSTKNSMELALEMWANVANLEFEQVTNDNEQADLGFLLVSSQETGSDGLLGLFGPPGIENAGIGYFNYEAESWNNNGLPQGSAGFATLLHELGHGLGLAHPHDNGGESPKYPGVVDSGDTGRYGLNQGVYTTMSYNNGLDGNSSIDYGNQGTPMALDIAAIQQLYGANRSHNGGDTTYRLPDQNQVGTYYSCIWDTGGTDTISAQGISLNTTINLNEAPLVGPNAGGYLSKAEGIDGGFTIANGVTLENAVGGKGDDVLVGNAVDNTLDGKDGDDVLIGYDGDDVLIGHDGDDGLNGGWGNDRLNGGQGRDKLYGKQDRDKLYGGQDRDKLYGGQDQDELNGGQDNDRLYGGQDDDVLNGGEGQDTLFGGQGSDRLSGGADNDWLDGGSGDDVLYGNGGSDLFVLAPGGGTDVIKDFDALDDRLGLASGLGVSDLTVVQLNNRVAIDLGGDRLALLSGVEASQLTNAVFESV